MRLQSDSCSAAQHQELREFSEWILNIGNGNLGQPNDGEVEINILDDLLLKNYSDPIEAIILSTYPPLQGDVDIKGTLRESAILAPKLSIVDEVNSYMLSLNDKEEMEYFSLDLVCKTSLNRSYQVDLLTPEALNGLKCSSLPNHNLKLKPGVPIMLVRNINQCSSLCNGTRLIVTQLANHVIEAEVMTGTHVGLKVFIP